MVEWIKRLLMRWQMWPLPPEDVDCYKEHPQEHVMEMRQDIRRQVHNIRNGASQLKWETHRALKESQLSKTVAHAAILKIEQAREARKRNEVPPN